ncbi:MAG: HIT domain-containing protein [Candidatus Omnitrophica bacterium]|nr:HIT domain-containing protein [Candidatus Omnitrophota bacterium]
MRTLWAPWREAYITKIGQKSKGCVFCPIFKDKNDAKNYVFLRSPLAFAVLNIFPYSNGHCLILPNRHVADISKLTPDELKEMMELLLKTKDLLQKALKPHGFNIGFNLGRIAGAGIPKHIHMHVVPRWKGDHNFMPVVGATKVISQSLKVVYTLLTDENKKRLRRIRR